MKKKLLILLLIFIGLFSMTGCGSKKEEKDGKKEIITPLMYEVTKEGSSNKIYILGTIHIGNLKNTEFAEYVTKSFDESHYVAAEIDNDDSSEDLTSEIEKMMYEGEDTLKNHVSEETYEKIMNFFEEKDLNPGLFDLSKMKLDYVARLLIQATIDESNLTTEEGIDEYFVNKAKQESKTFLEVEGTEFQENVLSGLSDRYYENMAIEVIDNFDQQVEEAKKAFDDWKKGNEEEIWKDDGSTIKEIDKSKYNAEDIKAAEEFDEKILYSRNITMTDKLEEYFNNNYDVFFMVGQDHVIGEKGIVSYLRQRGYTVNKISK